MKFIKYLIASLFLIPLALSAQVSITANHVVDAFERPLSAAKLCFAPVDAAAAPTGFRVGSQQVVPNAVCGVISNGVLQSGLSVAPAPTGVYYHIWAASRQNNAVIRDFGMTSITGTNWTLDTYDPNNAVLPVTSISVGTVTTLPAGSNATATLVNGGNGSALLNVGVPQGPAGPPCTTGSSGTCNMIVPLNAPQFGGASGYSGTAQVAGVGDSIVKGLLDTGGTDQLSYMAARNTNIALITNWGIGGQTSTQIATRIGAQPTTVTVSGGTIPASGGVTVTFTSGYEPCYNAGQQGPSVLGSIDGIQGTCTDNGSHVYTFTRSTSGSAVSYSSGPWTPVITTQLNGCVILDGGRNNLANQAQIQTDLALMAQTIAKYTNCWAFENITNSATLTAEQAGGTTYNEIVSINSWMTQTFGSAHVIDIRGALVANYNPSSAADVADHNNDAPPLSLRAQDASTTLASAISSTSTCAFSLTAPVSVSGTVLQIGSEYILLGGGASGPGTDGNYNCARGYYGTTPSTYSSGATVAEFDWLHPGSNSTTAANSNCFALGGGSCLANADNNWWTPQQTADAPVSVGTVLLGGLGSGQCLMTGTGGGLLTVPCGNLPIGGSIALTTSGATNNWYSTNYFWTNTRIQQQTPATSAANQVSPLFSLIGNYWNGSASVCGGLYWSSWFYGTGSTPQTNMTLGPSGPCPPPGLWTLDTSYATAPLIFPTAGFQFGQTGAVNTFLSTMYFDSNVILQTTTPATSGANVSGPLLNLRGNYWNGSASVCGGVYWALTANSGTNPILYAALGPSGACPPPSTWSLDLHNATAPVLLPAAGVQFGTSGSVITSFPVKYSPSLTPSAVSASSCAEQTFTVSGVATGQAVTLPNPPSAMSHVWPGYARVSAANTLAIQFCADATGGTPPTGTYTFTAQ